MENLTENDFQRVADLLGIEVAVVKAVQAVETGGHGGFVAPGRPM
ncbi:peptidoglycan-binding protein, partial [Bacteroides fragilis]